MEDKKTKIKFDIMAIVLIIIFCFAITPVTLQNDTFYTIKIGEYILDNGITMEEPFSWQDGLTYTFPHWAYDVIIYLFFLMGGQTGVYVSTILFCSILGIVLYLTNKKVTKNRIIPFITTIGALYMLAEYIAARAQLFTFILFVLTIYFIEKFLETKKTKFAIGLIIIPIILANVHVAVFPFYFILYMPYIAEYMIYILTNTNIIINKFKIENIYKKAERMDDLNEINKLKEKLTIIEEENKKTIQIKEKIRKNAYKIEIEPSKNIKYLILIMIVCLFTGLISPLGTTAYTYLVKTMQGTTTQNISEHQPLTLINNMNFLCSLIIFLGVLTFTDTRIKLRDFFMLVGLVFLTFYTRRQESMFILICIMILNKLVCSLLNKYSPTIFSKIEEKVVTIFGQIITVLLILIISVIMYKPKVDDEYINKRAYPVEASNWILENLDVKNIRLYNEYNYGSYLLYRDIPVFIDSRADLYSPEFNEDVTTFEDFLAISGLNNSDMNKLLDKYDFTHFIMYDNAKLRIYMKSNEEAYKQIYDDGSFCIYEKL